MDLESRKKWVDYSRAKDEMFLHTDIKQSPWYVVDADNKRRARLNCIHHLLSMFPYKNLTPEKIELPARQNDKSYVRPPISDQSFIPKTPHRELATIEMRPRTRQGNCSVDEEHGVTLTKRGWPLCHFPRRGKLRCFRLCFASPLTEREISAYADRIEEICVQSECRWRQGDTGE